MTTVRWWAICLVVLLGWHHGDVVADGLDARTRQTVVEALDKMLQLFDANDDKRLDQTEHRALEQSIVQQYGAKWLKPARMVLTEADANGDGILVEQEWVEYTARAKATRPVGARTTEKAGVRTVMVPMSDGLRLATDIYFPKKGKGPWPVILKRTPYGRKEESGHWDGVGVVQDMRGRFDSEGWNFPFVGCGWVSHHDGKDTVDWIRRQPWCDGRVFTVGGSALGITQNLMAVSQPEGLVAQYITVAAADLYRHAAYVGGALRKSQVEGWINGNHYDPKAITIMEGHYEYDTFWAQFNSMANSAKINVPAMHVGGWFDTFALGTIDAFRTRQHQGGPGAKGKQHLIMGPWTHGVNRPLAVPVAGKQFPNLEMPQAYTLEAWIERYLHDPGKAEDSIPPVAYYAMGDTNDPEAPGNEWRFAKGWPIPCKPTAYYFHADGQLSTKRPGIAQPRSVEYFFDPGNPCPTRGGCLLNKRAGPKKQNEVENRADVLTFTTEPLSAPIDVTGHPRLHVFLSSSAVDTDLSVRLTDVYPDGSSYLMAEGMLRVRYRESYTKSTLLEPGKVYPIDVELWPTSIVFNRGHRIRVAITSSNYPRFDVNPGTGKPWQGMENSVKQANRIFCNAQQASHIILPVVERK